MPVHQIIGTVAQPSQHDVVFQHFGVHAIGAIRGAAFAVSVAAAAVGPIIVGLAHETTGTYASAMVMLVLPVAVGIAATRIAPPVLEETTEPAPVGAPAQ